MNAKENIGYVVWGTKRGLSYFINSDNINTNLKEICDTLKDIRAVVRFADPKVDFYAIEFTSQYKVYTQYRSLYDWLGREGYMAITIYIPHLFKPEEGAILQLLNNIINYYWDNYVNNTIYQIKSNIREDKTWFDDTVCCINLIKDRGSIYSSPQNNKFGLTRYKDENELSIYFDNPYHREYYEFQEVLFIKQSERQFPSMQVLNINPVLPRYSVKFNYSDANISSEFYINGEAVENLNNILALDIIKAVFKKPFHHPIQIGTTVEQLLQENQNLLQGNTISINLKKLDPCKRIIQFIVRDAANKNKLVSDFSISVNNQIVRNTIWYGEDIGKDWKFIFSADDYRNCEYVVKRLAPDEEIPLPEEIDIFMQPEEKIRLNIVCTDKYTDNGIANITVNYVNTERKTNRYGEVYFEITKKVFDNKPSYLLSATGPGYEPYERSVHVNELIKVFRIKLSKKETSNPLFRTNTNSQYSKSEQNKNSGDNQEDRNDSKDTQIKKSITDEQFDNLTKTNKWWKDKKILFSIIALFVVLIFSGVLFIKIFPLKGGDKPNTTKIDQEKYTTDVPPPIVNNPKNDTVYIALFWEKGNNNIKLSPGNVKSTNDSITEMSIIKEDSTIRLIFTPEQKGDSLSIKQTGYQDTTVWINKNDKNRDIFLIKKEDTIENHKDKLTTLLKKLNTFDFNASDVNENSPFYKSISKEITEAAGEWKNIKPVEGFHTISAIVQCLMNSKELCTTIYSTKVLNPTEYETHFTKFGTGAPNSKKIIDKWIKQKKEFYKIPQIAKTNNGWTIAQIMEEAIKNN